LTDEFLERAREQGSKSDPLKDPDKEPERNEPAL
jgi:hypothetical protein